MSKAHKIVQLKLYSHGVIGYNFCYIDENVHNHPVKIGYFKLYVKLYV